jgi:hypothetical protein
VQRSAGWALACLAVVASSVSAYGRAAYVKSHVKHCVDKKPTRFLVKVGGKYGYIDSAGKLVIDPASCHALDFCNGYAVVVRDWNGKYGFIKESGEYAVPPTFALAAEFSEGHAWVNVGDREREEWTLIDESGNEAPKRRFPHPGTPVFQGMSILQNPKPKGRIPGYCVIDLKGKVLLKLGGLEDVFPYSDGMARCRRDSTVLAGPPRARFTNKVIEYGFLDERCAMVITTGFSDAGDFAEGVAPVCKRGRYGFIDKRGRYFVKPRFEYAGTFSEGLAPVRFTKREYPRRKPYPPDEWGYLDKRTRPAFKSFKACEALPFSEGFATILVTGGFIPDDYSGRRALCEHVKVIDRAGRTVFEMEQGNVMPFRNGLAMVIVTDPVSRERSIGYINTEGKYVWEPRR